MFGKAVCAIFVLFPAIVFCAGKNSACTTPNGELATCTGISSCKIITEAVLAKNRNAIQFAKSSSCGFDGEPLVCCGSTAVKNERYDYQGTSLLPTKTVCGIEKSFNRVTGGELTEIGEFPWMALLRYNYFNGTDAGFKCGGTLINNRYILTAAHCVNITTSKGFALDSVRLGEWSILTEKDCEEDVVNEECADPVVDVKIEEKVVNRQYNPITKEHDIALLRLEENVKYTDYIIPICLPDPNSAVPLPGSKLIVSGWGATENNNICSYSDTKLKADVPVVSLSDCSIKVRQGKRITDKQICAGGASNKDSCQGDSGGPLMGLYEEQITDRDQWYQEGIVSWGAGCGIVGVPAVYIRVAMYMEWTIDNLSAF